MSDIEYSVITSDVIKSFDCSIKVPLRYVYPSVDIGIRVLQYVYASTDISIRLLSIMYTHLLILAYGFYPVCISICLYLYKILNSMYKHLLILYKVPLKHAQSSVDISMYSFEYM